MPTTAPPRPMIRCDGFQLVVDADAADQVGHVGTAGRQDHPRVSCHSRAPPSRASHRSRRRNIPSTATAVAQSASAHPGLPRTGSRSRGRRGTRRGGRGGCCPPGVAARSIDMFGSLGRPRVRARFTQVPVMARGTRRRFVSRPATRRSSARRPRASAPTGSTASTRVWIRRVLHRGTASTRNRSANMESPSHSASSISAPTRTWYRRVRRSRSMTHTPRMVVT